MRSKLKLRENFFPLFVKEIKEATVFQCRYSRRKRRDSLGWSTPWRLGLGGSPPRRLGLLCALVWCGVGCAGRGGDGRGGWRGGADPVGGADRAVLDGLVLRAARDGHLLAALVFVGDCRKRSQRLDFFTPSGCNPWTAGGKLWHTDRM